MKELNQVILRVDIPDHRLKKGDIGTIVLEHNVGEAFEVEFMTLTGETIAIVTLEADQVRPIGKREIANARTV